MDKKTVNGNTGYAALPGIETGRGEVIVGVSVKETDKSPV